VRQVVQNERGEASRRRNFKVRHRSQNVVVRGDDQARSQMPGKVRQGKFRRIASENLSVNDSARRRLPVQGNVNSVAVRRLDFVNRSHPRKVADLQAKRVAKEKEYRARSLSRNSNELAHLREPNAPRDRDNSRKLGRREHQKKRHRQGRDNFIAITSAAPEEKLRTRFFAIYGGRCCRASVSDANRLSTHHRQNLFGMATVSSARSNLRELDSLECSSTFRELIPTFEEDDQSRLAAIAICCAHHMIR
jgi:hypothetical protein